MNEEELMYERILKMIQELYNDMTREKQETLEDLNGLREEIEVMIENLESDLEKEK